VRNHRARGNDQGAHRGHGGGPRQRRRARAQGGLRLRRNPRRPRLPHFAISRAVQEPPHGRLWRQSRESRPPPARRAARRGGGGRGGRRGVRGAVPGRPVVYGLWVEVFFPGGLLLGEGRKIAVGAGDAGADALPAPAGHYRSLPSAQVVLPPMTFPDATFLDFAAAVKKIVRVPVIAVGRLGDPAIATQAVASGKTDFVALGRTLIADPQWVAKLRREEPIRRCLACNTCINEMRGGAGVGCVVNAVAGRETMFADRQPPRGERIAVIGAGPAGLTYASLVAKGKEVTVFEKDKRPGGAFRYAGKAPLFQEVAASEASFERYIGDLFA